MEKPRNGGLVDSESFRGFLLGEKRFFRCVGAWIQWYHNSHNFMHITIRAAREWTTDASHLNRSKMLNVVRLYASLYSFRCGCSQPMSFFP